ncbi:hypothetical protein KUIN1_01060 [Pseudomonas sp. KUIN-1]|nr:hypothetical protein KUIN1_01060 [Pseudomonas sp. KUIN-1]
MLMAALNLSEAFSIILFCNFPQFIKSYILKLIKTFMLGLLHQQPAKLRSD